MAYIRRRYITRNAVDVEEYHSLKYGAPGVERGKKRKATPEQVYKRNHYNKIRTCREKIRTHFDVGDLFVTLTYTKDKRPEDMKQAKKDFAGFIRKLRKKYESLGWELKWIRNIEVGSRGGWHIHVIINRIPGGDTDLMVQRAWENGSVNFKQMHQEGEFRELAWYITKTEREDNRLREASYSTSRNLPVRDPEEKLIMRWDTFREVKAPEGWYLDKSSVEEGINPVTDQPFRRYTLIRIERQAADPERNRLSRNRRKRTNAKGAGRSKHKKQILPDKAQVL